VCILRIYRLGVWFFVTLDEILQKIQELCPEERSLLLRELTALPGKPEAECASPETVASLHQEQAASNDERGLPIEDVVVDPKPEDGA
jgi:hypothetical protein